MEIKPQNDTTNHSKTDNISLSATAFLSAAEHGNLELIKSYVEAGFPIDTLAIYKNTATQIRSAALHLACQENQYEIVKYLLANHANPNIKDFSDLVPLFYAIKGCSDKNIIELLIKHGANINAFMSGGISPLFLAKA
jgi:ankyrin repeat protein